MSVSLTILQPAANKELLSSRPHLRTSKTRTKSISTLDQEINAQFSKDAILLKRINYVFTTNEDKKVLLEIRKQLEKFSSNGDISIPITFGDKDFYLNRMAFELTFIGVKLPLQPFKMRWYEPLRGDELWDKDAIAQFIRSKRFNYNGILYPLRLRNEKENELDFAVSAESAHFAQDYLRDIFNHGEYEIVGRSVLYGLDEAPEHLKKSLFDWIDNPQINYLFAHNLVGDLGVPAGHCYGSRWASGAMTNLLIWTTTDRMKTQEVAQCIRAYTILFSLVDCSKISSPENKFVRKFISIFGEVLLELKAFAKQETDLLSISEHLSTLENILRNHKQSLQSKGLDTDLLQKFIQDLHDITTKHKAISYSNFGSYTEASNEIRPKKLTQVSVNGLYFVGGAFIEQPSINPDDSELNQLTERALNDAGAIEKVMKSIINKDKDFAEKIVCEITSINSPQHLLKEAQEALRKGRYVPEEF